jgi:hypothetical protein
MDNLQKLLKLIKESFNIANVAPSTKYTHLFFVYISYFSRSFAYANSSSDMVILISEDSF